MPDSATPANPSVNPDAPWYEQNQSLGRALRMLTNFDADYQELVGKELFNYAKSLSYTHIAPEKEGVDASTQGLQRLRSLMHNKRYQGFMGRCLNEAMALTQQGQTLVGQRLLLALQALDTLQQRYPEAKEPKALAITEVRLKVHSLVHALFNEELDTFKEKGEQQRHQKKAEQDEQAEQERLMREEMELLLSQSAQELEADNEAEALPVEPVFTQPLVPRYKRYGWQQFVWIDWKAPPPATEDLGVSETTETAA
jgi:hypothetical protein